MINQATIYKQTLMQKLLVRNYKWWYLIQYQIKHNTAYRSSSLIWMVGRLVILFTTIFIWWINIQGGSNLIEFNTIFTYYIFGSLISLTNGVQWNIAGSIKSGGISTRLLRPGNVMAQIIISDFGWWLFPTGVQILLLCAIALLGSQFIISATIIQIFLYVLMGIIQICVNQIVVYH